MPGGWQGSDRRDRLPADWPAIVVRIKRRDQGRCTQQLPSGKRCPRGEPEFRVQVDHLKPGDDHRDVNLACKCEAHHSKKSSQEGNSARWGKKKITPRTEGPHPGRLR